MSSAGRAWNRNHRLATLIAERGLSTKGFRRAMRKLVAEFVADKEARDDEFHEWFGKCGVVPAAYRIRRVDEGRGVWDVTVEVYEVEGTAEIADWKLRYYGDVADAEGPHVELHILDRYDHEIVVPSNDLMSFSLLGLSGRSDWLESERELRKWMRAQAKTQHHAPVIVDDSRVSELARKTRLLKRQLMKADHSQIAGSLEKIIYGLGAGDTHKDIAQNANVAPAVVRATARLLTAKNINPKDIVKETHARWKVAYDAVRELGIQI